MDAKAANAPALELAARIYVELVGRNAVVSEGGVKMAAGAENLALLSLRLAETFEAVKEQVDAAKVPKTTFKLDAANIAEWMK